MLPIIELLVIISMQDPQLLEFAWIELLEKNKPVTPEELAEVPYI